MKTVYILIEKILYVFFFILTIWLWLPFIASSKMYYLHSYFSILILLLVLFFFWSGKNILFKVGQLLFLILFFFYTIYTFITFSGYTSWPMRRMVRLDLIFWERTFYSDTLSQLNHRFSNILIPFICCITFFAIIYILSFVKKKKRMKENLSLKK